MAHINVWRSNTSVTVYDTGSFTANATVTDIMEFSETGMDETSAQAMLAEIIANGAVDCAIKLPPTPPPAYGG